MKKIDATSRLGGTPTAAAEAIGITTQAFSQWPDDLPPRLIDRVQAAIARRHLPASLLGMEAEASPLEADKCSSPEASPT